MIDVLVSSSWNWSVHSYEWSKLANKLVINDLITEPWRSLFLFSVQHESHDERRRKRIFTFSQRSPASDAAKQNYLFAHV